MLPSSMSVHRQVRFLLEGRPRIGIVVLALKVIGLVAAATVLLIGGGDSISKSFATSEKLKASERQKHQKHWI